MKVKHPRMVRRGQSPPAVAPEPVKPMPAVVSDYAKKVAAVIKTAVEKGTKMVPDTDAHAAVLALEPPLADVTQWIPTGFVGLDWLISDGRGVPMGRMMEAWGPEASCKSSIVEYLCKAFQRAYDNGVVAWKDAESTFDASRAVSQGVDPGRFVICSPPHMEACIDIDMALLRLAAPPKKRGEEQFPPILAVWDSIAQSPPMSEMGQRSGKVPVGGQPRLMSSFCRKAVRAMSERNMSLIFVNQVREKIGVMYGETKSRPCGHALDHSCSVILRFARRETLKRTRKNQDTRVGYVILVSTYKNRLAPPHRTVPIVVTFDHGPDPAASALLLVKKLGLLKAKGSAGVSYPDVVPGTFFPSREWDDVFSVYRAAIEEDLLANLRDVHSVKWEGSSDDSEGGDE